MQSLLGLQRRGLLSAEEFIRMATEITKTWDEHRREAVLADVPKDQSVELPNGSGRASAEEGLPSNDDEFLVGEDGELLSNDDLFGRSDDDDDLTFAADPEPPAVGTPSGSTGESQETLRDPATWPTRTKAMSSELQEVVFLRMGNAADFINDGRARVQYYRVKKGAKYKTELHEVWVRPETLTCLATPEVARPTDGSPQKKSPRIEGRAHARQDAGGDLPARAEIERKRKLPQKAAIGERGRQKATRQTTETKVSIEQRILDFPDHSLAKVDGKLCCVACRFFPANKWSSIVSHTKLLHNGQATAHARKLEAWRARAADDRELTAFLVSYYEEHPDEKAGTKDPDDLVYRYRVAESFVAHPPFTGIDHHKQLLQRGGHSLPGSHHLQALIPKIEAEEDKRLDHELSGEYIGIAFDGTTRLGEAVNTTGRWCTNTFELRKRLLDFTTLEKHVNNVELAAHITNVVMQVHHVPLANLVNISRDSVSVNGAACRRLMGTFTSAVGTLCICHTLCHVGEHFDLPTLTEFKTPWLELAGGRDPHRGAQMLWKQTVAPATVPGYSKVRWYAWAEILFVIAEAGMHRLGEFISTCEERDYGDATTKALRRIYNGKISPLRLELAAMLDMRMLVKITYELEGDRLEILLTYDRVEALRALGRSILAGADGVLPNVDAVLRRLMELKKGVKLEKHFDGHGTAVGTLNKKERVNSELYPGQECDAWLTTYEDGHEEHYEEEELRSGKYGPVPNGTDGKPVLIVRDLPERKAICDALTPGFNYLEARIMGTCDAQYSCVEMYELCRVVRAFDPNFASAHVTANFINAMSVITPLRSLGMLDALKQELPQYLSAAATAPSFDKASVRDYSDAILVWWRNNGKSFPAWALAARITFALSPSSASCEHVFALVKRLFGEQQLRSLKDYIQAALKLNYNERITG